MLTHLFIRDIVLFEACDVAFGPGLNVLTGETGAGKTILLDALGLALGQRSESGLVRKGAPQGTVTAEFDISGNKSVQMALEELGIESTPNALFIRRSLTQDGRSRCFINDQPVSVGALKRLGEILLEIHGQHDQRGLMDSAGHLEILDEFAGLGQEAAKLREVFTGWKALEKTHIDRLAGLEASRREEDYLHHIVQELRALSPAPGEEETLASLRTQMMQQEKFTSLVREIMSELQGAQPVESRLSAASRILSRSTLALATKFAPAAQALERAALEVQEALALLEELAADNNHDAASLEQAEERLFALKDAARKYRVGVDELPRVLTEHAAKLAALETSEQSLVELEKSISMAREAYNKMAEKLSAARRKAALKLEKSIHAELAPLKMAGTKFRVAFTPRDEKDWAPTGMESIRFEAATNAGSDFAPLSRIASGGELSRFMLAVKVALADVRGTPSYIFDEIDSGTGGAVADAIGQRLARLGVSRQVLVVTHLPQVAARGAYHLRIEKITKKNSARITVQALSAAERQEELARMLAGEEITQEARGAASRLLQAAG